MTMKTKTYISLLLCAVLLMGLLTGCAGASLQKTSASGARAANFAGAAQNFEMAEEAPAAMDEKGALTDAGADTTAMLPENRKWIVTVNLSAETEDLDAMTAALEQTVAALEGYVEDQRVYNGSSYSSRRYRSASFTVRIPAEDVERFAEDVAGIANVVSRETSREDVTLNYVATESRVKALQTEEARLLELMAQAENMSDLLEIEGRLTDVRYELERVASQLKLYDNQIDYATIYLSVEEVQEYTPVEEPTLWERIRNGFTGSLKGLGESILDLTVFLIAASPYLVVYGAIIGAIAVLIRKLSKNRKAKKQAKKPEQP